MRRRRKERFFFCLHSVFLWVFKRVARPKNWPHQIWCHLFTFSVPPCRLQKNPFKRSPLSLCGSHSCVHAPLQQVLVFVSPTRTNAHAHPSLRSHPSGHGEFNITSLTSGQCCLSSLTSLVRYPLCSNIASERVPAAGSCEAYSTTYCQCMHLRCDVFLVSAVLYPRTIRQAYSCATGRAISLTAYTVNSLHQILH